MDLTQRLRGLVDSLQDLENKGVHRNALALEAEISRGVDVHRRTQAQCLQLHRQLAQVQLCLSLGTVDYSKCAVLYVDDEEKSLKCFARAYGNVFRVLTASNAQEGLRVIRAQKDNIAILIANHRMPGQDGVWLLDQVRQVQPGLVRILTSTFSSASDLAAASRAANSGAIYAFVLEPWDPLQLDHLLRRAFEYFVLRITLDEAALALSQTIGED